FPPKFFRREKCSPMDVDNSGSGKGGCGKRKNQESVVYIIFFSLHSCPKTFFVVSVSIICYTIKCFFFWRRRMVSYASGCSVCQAGNISVLQYGCECSPAGGGMKLSYVRFRR
ncbi:MAG: hypothetical protein IJU50_04030, partial [Lachnospiraceae bacterium]|nr:hypothetical protein [Lachnospiraceae bacterium]